MNIDIEELAISHGAIIYNVGEFDEYYAMTKAELIAFAELDAKQSTEAMPKGYSDVSAVLPNGKTCTNVYDAYDIGLQQGTFDDCCKQFEPVAKIERNGSGQIYIQDNYGDAFDISKHIGAKLYLALPQIPSEVKGLNITEHKEVELATDAPKTIWLQLSDEPVGMKLPSETYHSIGYDKKGGQFVWWREIPFGAKLYTHPQQAQIPSKEQSMSELLQIQRDDAFEALAEEREKYDELEKICRAQHEAINQCANHLHEARLALMGFIDVKMDIYAESRKRAKQRKKINATQVF